jgi:hypothetical protein
MMKSSLPVISQSFRRRLAESREPLIRCRARGRMRNAAKACSGGPVGKYRDRASLGRADNPVAVGAARAIGGLALIAIAMSGRGRSAMLTGLRRPLVE